MNVGHLAGSTMENATGNIFRWRPMSIEPWKRVGVEVAHTRLFDIVIETTTD
jgi:hypothetical protein